MIRDKSLYKVYSPEEKPTASVFIVHGMQEYSDRYEQFAEYLKSRGIACVIYDLPGHGANTDNGELGWFGEKDGWKTFVDSAAGAAKLLKEMYPDVPVVFFGHSMGTMVGRCFLQQYDHLIDALILSGAPNYVAAGSAGIAVCRLLSLVKGKHGFSKLLDGMATGGFSKAVKNPETPLDWLSYNKENVRNYINDPLCGKPFTIQGYSDLFTMMKLMGDVKAYNCSKPALPIYLFAGKEDPCIGGEKGFADTIERLQKAGYHSVETKLYEHMRHETLNEIGKAEVYKDTADWIIHAFSSSK